MTDLPPHPPVPRLHPHRHLCRRPRGHRVPPAAVGAARAVVVRKVRNIFSDS